MMMMTRMLMSRVDVDDSGVNGVQYDRVELRRNNDDLSVDSGDDNDDPGVDDDDDDDSGGDYGDSNESGVDDAWCWRWQSIMSLVLTMTGF